MATCIAVGVVLCDLIVIFVSYGSWRNYGRAKGSLAFERQLGARVATDGPFFAAPNLDSEDVMVLAYRLKRQIAQSRLFAQSGTTIFYRQWANWQLDRRETSLGWPAARLRWSKCLMKVIELVGKPAKVKPFL